MAVSTVCAVLDRLGLNRLSRLAPPEPPNRYVRRRPGELIHVDIKKLARFVRPGHRVMGRGAPGMRAQIRQGWEFVHVAVDDYSRVAYVEILPDETANTAIGFLERAVGWFAGTWSTLSCTVCGFRIFTVPCSGPWPQARRSPAARGLAS